MLYKGVVALSSHWVYENIEKNVLLKVTRWPLLN